MVDIFLFKKKGIIYQISYESNTKEMTGISSGSTYCTEITEAVIYVGKLVIRHRFHIVRNILPIPVNGIQRKSFIYFREGT